MEVDSPQQQSLSAALAPTHQDQRDHRPSWDSTQQRGLSAIELERASQQAERGQVSFGQVAPQMSEPVQVRPSTSHVTFQEPPPRRSLEDSRSRYSDDPATPSRKRHAWYNGPLQHQAPHPAYASVRTSPDESGSSDGVPTPSNGTLAEINPAIVHSNGYVEHRPVHVVHEALPKMQAPPPHYAPSFAGNSNSQYQPYQHPPHEAQNATFALEQAQHVPAPTNYQRLPPAGNDMQRLEALVAVATRENQAVSGQ
jgi:hypothetical protein